MFCLSSFCVSCSIFCLSSCCVSCSMFILILQLGLQKNKKFTAT
jgi:hypothetical protein